MSNAVKAMAPARPGEPIHLERSPELTSRIILRQLKADPHCRVCRERLLPMRAMLLDYNGRFPDVVCRSCHHEALKGGVR